MRCNRARDELYAKQMGLFAIATSEGDTPNEVVKISFLLLLLLLSLCCSAGFHRLRVTVQALLIRYSAENLQTLRLVLSCTALCIRIFRAARRLSSCKFSFILFGIISIVGGTGSIVIGLCPLPHLISSSLESTSAAACWWCSEGCGCW